MPGGFDILGIALAFGASLSLSYVLARILVRIIYPGVRSWVEARKDDAQPYGDVVLLPREFFGKVAAPERKLAGGEELGRNPSAAITHTNIDVARHRDGGV